MLEPLSKKETHYMNLQGHGARIIEQSGGQCARLLSDFYHMQLEEPSIPETLALPFGRHVGIRQQRLDHSRLLAELQCLEFQHAAARAGEHIVTAPMVGTYYSAPSPGAKDFVQIGDEVDLGQVLCIIEAMKLMNEIESDVDGEVQEIFVENGKPVEYGQRLFSIRPVS